MKELATNQLRTCMWFSLTEKYSKMPYLTTYTVAILLFSNLNTYLTQKLAFLITKPLHGTPMQCPFPEGAHLVQTMSRTDFPKEAQ